MSGLHVGAVQPVLGLQAAPDTNNRRRLSAWMARYAADMSGESGGIVGADLGDGTRSFSGPVKLVPDPRRATNGVISGAGIYRPVTEYQQALGDNPQLDPFRRLLWARVAQ